MPAAPPRLPGLSGASWSDGDECPGELYQRLGLPFGKRAEASISAATSPQNSRRQSPWGRVGFSKTAFQPMDSRANAWAWKHRLPTTEQEDVIEHTADVASLFYTGDELR